MMVSNLTARAFLRATRASIDGTNPNATRRIRLRRSRFLHLADWLVRPVETSSRDARRLRYLVEALLVRECMAQGISKKRKTTRQRGQSREGRRPIGYSLPSLASRLEVRKALYKSVPNLGLSKSLVCRALNGYLHQNMHWVIWCPPRVGVHQVGERQPFIDIFWWWRRRSRQGRRSRWAFIRYLISRRWRWLCVGRVVKGGFVCRRSWRGRKLTGPCDILERAGCTWVERRAMMVQRIWEVVHGRRGRDYNTIT